MKKAANDKYDTYLAADLGAGSGRIIAGKIADNKILIEEIHRFPNYQVKLGETFYWDFPALFHNILTGIGKAAASGCKIAGIGVDTWGVDFGLIDGTGKLIANPVCYRDSRTRGMKDIVREKFPDREMYMATGTEQMEINTIYQLTSLQQEASPQLEIADKMLFMPDLVNYFLTGRMAAEQTIASTSQLMDIRTRKWNSEVLEKTGIRSGLLPELILPGTDLGKLRPDLSSLYGLTHAGEITVYSVGSHDTASAVATVSHKVSRKSSAFISSGTWSLMGVCSDKPDTSLEAFEAGFTNEAGIDGKILVMSNITGLWIFQRMIEEWKKEESSEIPYQELLDACLSSSQFGSIIDTDHPGFNNPDSMCGAISAYCGATSQPAPQSKGEFVRCVMESLALKYRFKINSLGKITGREIDEIIIVGGGSRNTVLNRFISDALGVKVIAGPAESTAIGNILQQAISAGKIGGWEDAAHITDSTFPPVIYTPENPDIWNEPYEKFCNLISLTNRRDQSERNE